MIPNYTSYQVKPEDSSFITSTGQTLKRSAVVTFFDSSGNELDSVRFGAPDMSDVYEAISRGDRLDLDNCYIPGFSMAVYRNLYELEKNQRVVLESLSARDSFFESQIATDFSHTELNSGSSFEGTHFGRGKVLFNSCLFTGNVNFSGTYFINGHIEFTGCQFREGDFAFKNSVFNDGIKDFSDVQFGSGEITFANTEFAGGDLLFINTRFNDGKFNFKIARVSSGRVDFHYAAFGEGEVSFERSEFGDSKVDFRAVDFGSGRVNFNRSVFGDGDISFEGASCREGKIQFKRALIGNGNKDFTLLEMPNSELNFEKTVFGPGNLSFLNSKIGSLVLKSCYLNHYVDLRVSRADNVDLSDTIIRDIIDLETYDHQISIGAMNMAGMRLNGKIYIDWDLNNCVELILMQPDTNMRQKAEQFRILKVNFNQIGKYEDEDKAYIMFKRYEAKTLIEKSVGKGLINRMFARISNGFRWLVFDAAGLYATNPLRVLFSMLICYIIFSLIYYLQIKFSSADIISGTPDQLADLPRAFYHSVITFFTIGYGDHYPHGAVRIVSGIEGFVGVFLMSYFTVAFVRKVLR